MTITEITDDCTDPAELRQAITHMAHAAARLSHHDHRHAALHARIDALSVRLDAAEFRALVGE